MKPVVSIKDRVIILIVTLVIFWWIITHKSYNPNRSSLQVTSSSIEIESISEPNTGEKVLLDNNATALKNDQNLCSIRCQAKYWTNVAKDSSVEKLKFLSTCSDEKAFYRGQNVVAFSYFDPGDQNREKLLPMYQKGMLANIEAVRKYYPGFVVRIYTDASLEGDLCEMVCANPDIQWCDIRRTPKFGDLSKMYFMTWRFLPLGDPTVNIFLSRDLDSVISEREFQAVRDWVGKTTKPISVLRDHVNHEIEILGGTWGAINSLLGEFLALQVQAEIISEAKSQRKRQHKKGFDQYLLVDILWPLKQKIVAYDSYFCKKSGIGSETEVRPFPISRKNVETDFVGNRDLGKEKWKLEPCPRECRPSYGKNWTYC